MADISGNLLQVEENDYRILGTPSVVAKKTFFYLQETGHLKAAAFRNTSRQNLQSFLFIIVLEGHGTLHYENAVLDVPKGHCFFIDCRQPHSYQSDPENPWEILWVHFDGCTTEDYFNLFRAQTAPVFCPASTVKFVSILQELLRVNNTKSPEAEILTSNLLVELLTQLLLVNSLEAEDDALHVKLKAVRAYLDENFCEDISLDALAERFFISKYYLTREFGKTYGETIFQHLIALRINYAKRLLRFTDQSVDEISRLCGFHDQSYFTKQFKKSESMTCLAFRKRWRD